MPQLGSQMKKQQKSDAVVTIREAKALIRQLAEGHQEMTLEFYHRILNQLDDLQQIMMDESK